MTSLDVPFDLRDFFVNEIAGSELILIFLAAALIAWGGASMRMPNQIIILVEILFMLIMCAFFPFLLPLTLVLIAGFVGWNFYKFIRG